MPANDSCNSVVAQWVNEMRRVRDTGVIATAVILAFVFIDAMAHISRAENASKAVGKDFKDWVDRYMKSQEPAEYRYTGEDLYAARCDLLHTFSNQFRKTKKNFGYHDGSHHRYRPDDANLVMLSVTALVDDLWQGISRFLAEQRRSGNYALIEKRFGEVFAMVPFGAA